MTYNVFSGTLNPTQSIYYKLTARFVPKGVFKGIYIPKLDLTVDNNMLLI